MKPKLLYYQISIPECAFTTSIWNTTAEKALKEAFKIAFERRGVKVFRYDKREFVDATAFKNYIVKSGKLDQICKNVQSSI